MNSCRGLAIEAFASPDHLVKGASDYLVRRRGLWDKFPLSAYIIQCNTGPSDEAITGPSDEGSAWTRVVDSRLFGLTVR